jgi:hypothetical protein
MRIARFQSKREENRNDLGLIFSVESSPDEYVLALHTGVVKAGLPISRLEPGDIILSGTPSGVAMGRDDWYLRKEDLVEVEVPGLGRLENRIM